MTGVEVIVAALLAGAGAGATEAVSAAVRDAYTGLRTLVTRVLGRRPAPEAATELLADPASHREALAAALQAAGAEQDAELVAAAQRVLAAADPVGWQAGKYQLAAPTISGGHVGDTTNQVGTNYGAVGEFNAPVSFGTPPVPPTQPGVA